MTSHVLRLGQRSWLEAAKCKHALSGRDSLIVKTCRLFWVRPAGSEYWTWLLLPLLEVKWHVILRVSIQPLDSEWWQLAWRESHGADALMQGNGPIKAPSRLCPRGICTAPAVRWWFVHRPSGPVAANHRPH